MQILNKQYRNNPPDAKCYFRNEKTALFHKPHQQRLFFRNYASEHNDLLSVLLVCRTLAQPGDWHRRINPDFLNITYIHSGETKVRINDFSFTAEQGDLILMPPGTDYEFGTFKTAVRSGIIVQGSMVEVILRNLRNQYVFPEKEPMGYEQKIERFFQVPDAGEHQLSVWSFDILSSLTSNDNSCRLPEILQKILLKMKNNLERPLVLNDFAEEAGISSRTMSRIFQKHLQISPHQYLLRLRMKRACQMLICDDFSIKEIAISVGYKNALNFSSEFRRVLGCSPSGFRTRKDRYTLQQKLDQLPDVPTNQDNYLL